jgi:hypothetical protein
MNDKEVLEKLKRFGSLYAKTHKTNQQDFRVSKLLASGRGFNLNEFGPTIWSQDRAQVCLNIMEPIVNSIVYKFVQDPYDFKAEQEVPNEIVDISELKFQLSGCLREMVQDGLSYLYIYKENNRIEFKKLNNFNVIFGATDFADGDEVKEVVYLDKKEVKERRPHSKSELKTCFDKILNMTEYEIPILTYWCKEDNGTVTTYHYEDDKLESKVNSPIENIPIVRIYAKEMPIDNERNWRGLFYLVKDLLRTIDLYASLLQERVCTAPNHWFNISAEAMGNDTSQWTTLNDIPVAAKTYHAFNPSHPDIKLDPPALNDMRVPTEDLIGVINVMEEKVYQILGNVSGNETGNETAQAVLLRRENKESTSNDILKNLLDSCYHICDILQDYTGLRWEVTSDIFQKTKKNEELEKIFAITTIINQNPNAYSVLPTILSKSDLPEETQYEILQQLSVKDGILAEANQRIQQLEAAAQSQQAQIEAQLIQAQMAKDTNMANLTLDAEVEAAKLELEWAKLGQKEGDNLATLAKDVAKIQADYRVKKEEMQLKREKGSGI